MRKAADTIFRQWEMLQVVPRFPARLSTREIKDSLARRGHEVDVRTIQRDLDNLSAKFPLCCDRIGQRNYWYWTDSDSLLEIPKMSSGIALTLQLAHDYLEPVIPRAVLRMLSPYFSRAKEVLNGTRFQHWRQKVRLIDRGPILMPPEIEKEVRDATYEALASNLQLSALYRSKSHAHPKEFVINPLGLVIRHGIYYLVATLWNYDDVRQLALHRMSKAKVLDSPSKPKVDFDLTEYIHDDAGFAYPYSNEDLNVEIQFDAAAAQHLLESPLSKNQKITLLPDEQVMVRATVKDTSEFRWWLLGFGAQAEVIAPGSLRTEFAIISRKMIEIYDPQVDPAKFCKSD